jgi:hypothetical protein
MLKSVIFPILGEGEGLQRLSYDANFCLGKRGGRDETAT